MDVEKSRMPAAGLTEAWASVEKPPEETTRAKLLGITERLMSARGYEGVAIKDIAAIAGIRPAAIFYHFPTKADLVTASLDAATVQLDGMFAGIAGDTSDPKARIAAFITRFGEVKRQRGEFCFAGVLAAGRGGLPENVMEAVVRSKSRISGWIAGHLREAFPDLSVGRCEAQAEAVLALAEGALLVARMANDPAAYDRVVGVTLPTLLDPRMDKI